MRSEAEIREYRDNLRATMEGAGASLVRLEPDKLRFCQGILLHLDWVLGDVELSEDAMQAIRDGAAVSKGNPIILEMDADDKTYWCACGGTLAVLDFTSDDDIKEWLDAHKSHSDGSLVTHYTLGYENLHGARRDERRQL